MLFLLFKKERDVKLLKYILTFFILYSSIAWSQMNVISAEQKRYSIENKKIKESSGLACSTRDKHLLWTHNDSGHMPIIYAMGHKGQDRATFHLDGIESYDWEDMDAFKYQGEHYLLIADTGDNLKLRWDYQINVIKEPNLERKSHSAISPSWAYNFQYEDGLSYDVESVAVDVVHEKILMLSKRTSHAIIFELPFKPIKPDEIQIAVKVGELKNISKPSALDISIDGKLLSINTYRRVHRFRRDSDNNENKSDWHYKDSLKYKGLFQPEAMCLRKDEKYYYISSERKPYLVKLKAQ